MDNFFMFLRRTLVLSVLVMFTFVIVYVPHPTTTYNNVPEAEAFFGGAVVIDPANIAQNTISAINNTSLFQKEFVLDGIATAVARGVIASLVASTVTWINSGFEGSPAFVQDLDGFLLNVGDELAGSFLQELGGEFSFLCSPFQLDIRTALAINYQVARERIPYQGCRVSEVFEDFEQFIGGDFAQGGWADWLQITTQPEVYTPFGALQSAERTLEERLAAAEETETRTLNFGNGFLSSEQCEDVPGPDGTSVPRCRIVTPGSTIANSLNKTLGAGQDALIAADEINEIVGALLGQVAKQAITGSAGLLGLSTNDAFAGGFNGQSFTDSIAQEATDILGTYGGNTVSTINTYVRDIETIQRNLRELLTVYVRYGQESLLPNSPLRPNANEIVRVAQQIRDDLTQTEQILRELQNERNAYETLDRQLSAPNLTPEQRKSIEEQKLIAYQTLLGKDYARNIATLKSNVSIYEVQIGALERIIADA